MALTSINYSKVPSNILDYNSAQTLKNISTNKVQVNFYCKMFSKIRFEIVGHDLTYLVTFELEMNLRF